VWSGGSNLAPGPLGSVAGGPLPLPRAGGCRPGAEAARVPGSEAGAAALSTGFPVVGIASIQSGKGFLLQAIFLGRTPRRTRECGASGLSPYPSNSVLLKEDPRPLSETEEEREKESEGGGYEVAVKLRNTALCSERKMPLADRS
jgi:hypothetical protein